MKKTKWIILGITLLFGLHSQAQTETISDAKILMQLEEQGQTNAKTYECQNFSFKYDRSNDVTLSNDYDMIISLFDIADDNLIKWIADPQMFKTIKITSFKSGKKDREYLLQNASVKSYLESIYYYKDSVDNNASSSLMIQAEQIKINGISVKKK